MVYRFPVVALLLGAAGAAFTLLHLIPPSTRILFPALNQCSTGVCPDGTRIRLSYTGNDIADKMLAALVGFFTQTVDGQDEATRLYALWFLPQWSVLLTFWWWEAGRARLSPVRLPVLAGAVAQLVGVGVATPLYFLIHVLAIPAYPTARPRSPATRSRAVLPAVLLGYIVPSMVLYLWPMSLDAKQVVAAIWQPVPLYISVLHILFRAFDSVVNPANNATHNASVALMHLKRAYYVTGLVSALSHLAVIVPSLFASTPTLSLVNIFIPQYAHQYLAISPIQSSLPPYRDMTRVFLQHDYAGMTVSALIFFAWSHYAFRALASPSRRTSIPSMAGWVMKVLVISIFGGPGAAIAWAAVQREEHIFKARMDNVKKQ